MSLAGSGLSDPGIAHLAGLTNLEVLDLRRTKATEPGIKKLSAALPGCKIEWDGGVIEPAPSAAPDGAPPKAAASDWPLDPAELTRRLNEHRKAFSSLADVPRD